MNVNNISLAFYSVIFTAFVLRLANKFKLSFAGKRMPFSDCKPPYAAAEFVKSWRNSEGNLRSCTRTLVLGPELKNRESNLKLINFCKSLNCSDGYRFCTLITLEWVLASDGNPIVGNTDPVKDIMAHTDIMHIMGLYYELAAQEI